jgi:hypothetical protein
MTGDLGWVDKALAKSRERARAWSGPVPEPAPPEPAPPEPAPPEPAPGPSGAAGKIPAGPMGAPPAADLIRQAVRRRRR